MLDTFERAATENTGDALKATDAAGKPLIVRIVEKRDGIKTQYQPAGAPGVIVDVADVNADSVYVNILWMNGPLVDNFGPLVGKTVPVKLVKTSPKGNGYPYLVPEALTGAELNAAQAWAQVNPSRFEQRRTELTNAAQADAVSSGATGNMAAVAASQAPAPADGQPDVQDLLRQLAEAQAK